MCVLLTNSQILAREVCQQGCAAWDKLQQVTTGGRREECKGGKLQEFCACFSAYSWNKTHLCCHSTCGIEVCVPFFFEQNYFRKGGNLHIGNLSLTVWLSSMSYVGDDCWPLCFLALC